jgi:WD40 repeat protein
MRFESPLNRLRHLLLGVTLLLALGAISAEGLAQNKAERKAVGGVKTTGVESDAALAVAYSPRGSVVAAAGFGGDIRLWDPRTLDFCLTIPAPNRSIKRALVFSPDGQTLAVAGDDRAVRLYDVGTGQPRQVFGDHIGFMTSIAFSPDGKTLASTAFQHEYKDKIWTGKIRSEIRLWDVASGQLKQTWVVGDNCTSMSLAYSPDGKLLASAEGPIHFRNVLTGEVKSTLKPDRGGVFAVGFSADGKLVAGGGGYGVPVDGGTRSVGELYVWNFETGKLHFKRTDLPGDLRCVAFSPDSRMIATGSSGPVRTGRNMKWVSSEMRIWSANTGELIRAVEGPLGYKLALAFSPDGRMILSCDHQEVVLTEASTGLNRATLFPR